MKKKVIEIDVKTDKAVKNTQKLDKSVKGVGDESKKTGKVMSGALGKVDSMTGGLITSMRGLTGATGGAAKGFNILKLAIIGSGIGALVIAVLSLKQAFTRSEEGQNKFAKMMGIIGAVTDQLLDVLADLGEAIIGVFENPKEALKSFAKSLKENITNRVESLLDTFGYLGSAIKKVFSGDFDGAMADAKKAGSSYIDTMTGVKDTINKTAKAVKDFANETIAEAKIAGDIADKRAKAEKVARELITERAKADRDIADLRFKSEQRDKYTAEERVKFLEEASKISEDITNKEIEQARLLFEAKKAENELGKSTKEDKREEEELAARLIQLDTKKLNLQKRLQTSITTFNNEVKAQQDAEIKAKEAEILAAEKKEEKRVAEIEKLEEANKLRAENEAASEAEKLELEKQRELAKLEALNATEQQKAATIKYWDDKIQADKKGNEEDEANRKKTLRQQEIAALGATLGQIGNILGKESKAGKAFALGAALINTYQGISAGVALGYPQAIPAVIAAAATGFKAVKNIMQTKPKATAAPSQQQVSTGGATAIPRTPSFNIVGGSTGNQIAEIGKTPVKAFVVSGEVTTAQQLERNAVSEASI